MSSWYNRFNWYKLNWSFEINWNYFIYIHSHFFTFLTFKKVLLQAPHPVGDVARAEPRRGSHLCVWNDLRRRRRRDSDIHIFQRKSRENLGKRQKKTWKRRRVDLQNKPKVSKSDQTNWQVSVSGYCGSCRNSFCRYVMTGPMTFFAVSLLCWIFLTQVCFIFVVSVFILHKLDQDQPTTLH